VRKDRIKNLNRQYRVEESAGGKKSKGAEGNKIPRPMKKNLVPICIIRKLLEGKASPRREGKKCIAIRRFF